MRTRATSKQRAHSERHANWWLWSSYSYAPVVFLQAAQQSDAGAFNRSPGWVSVALTSQPSPCTPAKLVLFQASSEHGRQSSPSWAGVTGRGSGGAGGGAGGQTQSVLPHCGQSTSPGHFCGGFAVGLQQMFAGLAQGSLCSRRSCPAIGTSPPAPTPKKFVSSAEPCKPSSAHAPPDY